MNIINKEKTKMIEKVNPYHPDKIADRIAGAIVDLAYTKDENPKMGKYIRRKLYVRKTI